MLTLREFIKKSAQQNPQKTFLFFPETTNKLSYQNLYKNSEIISQGLQNFGLKKGDVVGFLLQNGIAAAEIFLGTIYGGFVVSPLNLIGLENQWEYAIIHSKMKVLFYDEKYKKFAEKLKKELNICTIEQNKNQSPSSFFVQKKLKNLEQNKIDFQDEALLMYTSGTTGNPKGVLLTNQNIIAGGKNVILAHQLEEKDCGLCILPLYHINAQIVSLVASLVAQSSLVLPNKFSVGAFWNLLEKYKCSWFSLVPTIASYLLHDNDKNNKKLDFLKFGRSASAPLTPEIHKKFEKYFGVSLIETMGITEAAAQILSNPLDPSKKKYGSAGIAFGNEVKIVDKNFKDCLLNQEGEIVVKGENVMKGYFQNEKETKKSVVNGWLKTGDLGRMDKDGFVFVTGRIKELIIKGGENIAPKEIDEILYSLQGVVEAASFAIEDKNYGEEIAAALVVKNKNYSEKYVIDYCIKKLGNFKAPKKVYFLDDLPKGSSGKIQRNKIIQLLD